MDVTLPNGRVIRGVPEGTSKEDIMKKAVSSGLANQSDFGVVEQQTQPQPVQETTIGEDIIGGLETAATVVSGAIAEPLAGFAGIAQSLNPFAEEGAGAQAVEDVRSALTYEGGEASKKQLKSVGETLAPVGEVLSSAETFLGEGGFDIAKSLGANDEIASIVATAGHTLPTAALELLGIKGARRATAIKEPSKNLIKKTLIESAPEAEQVRKAAKVLYNEVSDSGAVVNKSALGKLESSLDRLAKEEGIREGVSDQVFKSISAIKKDINRGGPIPISEITDLRKIARNAVNPMDANITRQALLVLDEVDSFIADINVNDLTHAGNIGASEISKKLKSAGKLYGRAKRAEMLEGAITTGASRKAGIDKGIRNELNRLINNKKTRKFLSQDDIKAIRKVTDGDFKQNIASLIGGMGIKFENSPSVFNAMISGAGTGSIASSLGMSGAALPVAVGAVTVGTASKLIANKLARGNANFLKTMQLAGNDAKRVTNAYLKAVPKNKRSVSDLSDLLLDPNIDLSTLENIANETIQDAVKAAQFKRELLQASTALGVGANLENEVSSNKG